MSLPEKMEQFVCRHNLFHKKSKIIATVSGGADSIALAHLLSEAGYEIIIAHCNFGLRGADSDTDELYVENFAKKKQVPFFVKRFSSADFEQRKKMSVEEAARDMRYQWFEKLIDETNFDCIATAHHLNDAIETFFINLTAGTGIRGIKSIPIKNGKIVRPLLFAKRQEIEDYCRANEIQFRTDKSNFDSVFVRNKFRHTILPQFSEINPNFEDTMKSNFLIFRDLHNIYTHWSKISSEKIISRKKGFLYIDIEQLLQSVAPQSLLFETLRPYGFKGKQIEDILSNIDRRQSGKIFYSHSHKMLKDRKFLVVGRNDKKNNSCREIYPDTSVENMPVPLKIEFVEYAPDFDFENKNVAYFKPEVLKFPLELRTMQQGDRFFPFGMKGKKLVSDFYTDLKINQFEKEETYLLLSGGQIAWVIGHRTDERFKITPDCKEVVRIERLLD